MYNKKHIYTNYLSDRTLGPIIYAVGHGNFQDVTPVQIMSPFNGFMKSVILRVNEARDLGDTDRYHLYEVLKNYTAAPPDTVRVNEKNLREYYVMNVCGVVITTNHKAGGLYLPADDRRHFVAWSDKTQADFPDSYWYDFWKYYESGGYNHIAAYLMNYDLTDFDPKAPPKKTEAFWEIADSNRSPEDSELSDCIDRLDNPDVLTVGMITEVASPEFKQWLKELRNRKKVASRLETAGYVLFRNVDSKDGRWKLNGKKVTIYSKKELSVKERHNAVYELKR